MIPEKVQNNGYIKISTINGNTGYVQKEYVLTDIKYSFMFEKNNEGIWKIINIDSIKRGRFIKVNLPLYFYFRFEEYSSTLKFLM